MAQFKKFSLVIEWDKLRYGAFPTDVVRDCDPKMSINISSAVKFKQHVRIETEIPEDADSNQIAFELGALVGTLTAIR